MNFSITFQEKGSSARCGILKTYHSEIQTPVFMPIGTQGVIKTIDPAVLEQLETQIIYSENISSENNTFKVLYKFNSIKYYYEHYYVSEVSINKFHSTSISYYI